MYIMTSIPEVYLQRSNAGVIRAHYLMVNTGFKCARRLQREERRMATRRCPHTALTHLQLSGSQATEINTFTT